MPYLQSDGLEIQHPFSKVVCVCICTITANVPNATLVERARHANSYSHLDWNPVQLLRLVLFGATQKLQLI